MADHRFPVSEESEERTEPFSQSEIDSRMKSIRVEEPDYDVMYDTVPLTKLMVEEHHHKQGIRILVRPLTRSAILKPYMSKALSPGTWRIIVDNISVLDFRVLEKVPAMLKQQQQFPEAMSMSFLNSSGKRSLEDTADEAVDGRDDKKAKLSDDATPNKNDGVIMFLRPAAEPLVFPLPSANKGKELVSANGHALLDVGNDEMVEIPGSCEIDAYTVTKHGQIASTSLSSVYTATHSNVPDGIVTVKVLKTLPNNSAAALQQKPQEAERNVIRQADMWLREYQSQDDLRHDSIVRLYGATPVSFRSTWNTDNFIGDRTDATRILRDVASALHYLHSRRLVHNDIKPANILYSPARGAVLCDFGLSTMAGGPATNGGTPFYVPPEFIGARQRGPASDVWALGVTMLYVLRRMPFPDGRGRQAHPKRLYWVIADLNRPPGRGRGAQGAVEQMKTWLGEVREAADRLNPRDRLERIVREMLVPNLNQRITTARIMRELFVEREQPQQQQPQAVVARA
ncbi:MAP kinase kinase skh1/pek1 [Verticillium alfalfae VaMs.102]|uniref:MAP kinase kinase skh1/pek1 n=1 Tax=Verticillium alfalfae (strain VaMs.102 / ATCC MYA-4576 / FGSC 10136) TaxID=526221 RepID=C9SQM5_VERA1|nr:MAP kinase kinase skh1/pek1 [Verticillium alfalfae VaMs.102]EEY21150.1 MAP kinase kinase skh1/pek1 [Verticillium alfalfae VaMs.102]